MNRRNRRRSSVSDFFAGFSEGYNTLNQVAQDIQMQRAATAEPEFAGATEVKPAASAEPPPPAKTVTMTGQEARQVGAEQATPDSAKTGLGVNQGVKLSQIEPISMANTVQAMPEVGKVKARYQIAGRDVDPTNAASVDRGRTLAMADVMARYDPAQAMRMRSDLTRQERDEQRFEWEKNRVARDDKRAERDDEKAKREEADQLWLRNLGTVLSSRDPNAIANFYNQQYQDGLTAKVVPGQNGAFTVVRADKAGKVVDQTPFQSVDQFISSAVPSLLASRDPLKAYQLQQDAAERQYRRDRDQTGDTRWKSEFDERKRLTDAQIRNMDETRGLRRDIAAMQAEARKAGKGGDVSGVDLDAIDKTLAPLFKGKDAEGNESINSEGLAAVRGLARAHPAAAEDPSGAALAAANAYRRAMAESGGDHRKAMAVLQKLAQQGAAQSQPVQPGQAPAAAPTAAPPSMAAAALKKFGPSADAFAGNPGAFQQMTLAELGAYERAGNPLARAELERRRAAATAADRGAIQEAEARGMTQGI